MKFKDKQIIFYIFLLFIVRILSGSEDLNLSSLRLIKNKSNIKY